MEGELDIRMCRNNHYRKKGSGELPVRSAASSGAFAGSVLLMGEVAPIGFEVALLVFFLGPAPARRVAAHGAGAVGGRDGGAEEFFPEAHGGRFVGMGN